MFLFCFVFVLVSFVVVVVVVVVIVVVLHFPIRRVVVVFSLCLVSGFLVAV